MPALHLIGNAHIDPVWIWDWHEGMHEVLQTFRAALERLDDNPDLVFTASSAAYYDWVERVDPEMFERIKAMVATDRWCVVGGQWIEPDCNLPSGEAICRQLLQAQRYFADRFGTPASVGFNVDSFGHTSALPQLLRGGGLRGYVMMRPQKHEKELPAHLFAWQGVDGTTIPTYRVPFEYSTRGGDEDHLLRERSAALLAQQTRPLMLFFGIGDHGGGPTRLAIKTLRDVEGDLAFSSPDAFFDAASDDLPLVGDELQWHAVGCYSAMSSVKEANARAERALLTAETMTVLCRALTGRETTGGLRDAWRALLFTQFHDSLGGTCSAHAHAGLAAMTGRALAVADEVTTAAAHAIVQQIDTWTGEAATAEGIESAIAGVPVPLVVFNPLGWPATYPVTLIHPIGSACDADGNATPVQQVPSGEVTYSPTCALLQAAVPACGYRLYWLRVAPGDAPPTSIVTSETQVGNAHVDAHVDPATGGVRVAGEGVAADDVRPVVIDDPSDTWSHGVAGYGTDEQRCRFEGVELVERGPVRATLRLRWTWRSSTIVQDVSVYDGQPFVELRFEVDWHEPAQVLKVVVPVNLTGARCTAGAPYGHVARRSVGHEDVMQRWVDLGDGEVGLACTTDWKYAYDATGARLRITALRSPRYADHGWGWASDADGYPFTDQGLQRFSMRLHPHRGSWADASLPQRAEEHLTTPPVVLDTWHAGRLGDSASHVAVTSSGVAVSAVKPAESGNGTVVRAWEVAGIASGADVRIGESTWRGSFHAHEVKTLHVSPGGEVTEIRLTELG